MRKFLTKKEVVSDVRAEFREAVSRGEAQRGDEIMRREMFNDRIDFLLADGAVPKSAYHWSNPF